MTITEATDVDRRFSKSDISNGPAEACLGTKPNLQTLKFEREDWTLFRTVDGLQQKAGVPAKLLQRLVLKELGDNALDTGAQIRCGEFDEDVFYISKMMDRDSTVLRRRSPNYSRSAAIRIATDIGASELRPSDEP